MIFRIQLERVNSIKLETLKAISAITVALIFLAIAPIFIRLVENELSPNATIFNRLLGAAIIFGCSNLLSRHQDKVVNATLSVQETTKKDYFLLLLSGCFFWASQVSWAWSLQHTTVAISDLLHNFTPLCVVLGGWLIKRQSFSSKFLLGTFLSILGCCMIGFEHFSYALAQIQGDIAAMLSAVFLAGYMLIGETLCQKFSTVSIMSWVCTVGAVLSIPMLTLSETQCYPSSLQGWIFTASLVLTMVLGQGLLLYGVEQIGASLVAVLFLLDPVFAAIAAWFIFAEALSMWDWAAMIVVLCGVYLAISSVAKMSRGGVSRAT